ncbi:MAG: sodium-translocating pyrophosphatase [Firmicutes bacterium]|nr:sodium-translocating pyrophosphatase [Bacillota bacterium]
MKKIVTTAMLVLAMSGYALASEAIELPKFNELPLVWPSVWIVFISALIGLAFGAQWLLSLLKESPGPLGMSQVSDAIREGAWAYLKKQMATMVWFVIAIAIALFILYSPIKEFQTKGAFGIPVYMGVSIAFVLGVVSSYLAGMAGMMMAVRANCRVANAALTSFKKSLYIAFRSGAVSGMATVGLGLLGACIIFFMFQEQAMKVLIGFGFGGCLAALFMRVGGGIYTKAADVGADLVGKVEKDIPEDDPRNAATIADNVGDNVGDCAGMAADVFESYEVTLVAAIILGAAAGTMLHNPQASLALMVYPLLIRSIGVFASIIGVYSVKGSDDMKMDPMQPINTGFYVSAAIAVLGFIGISYYVFNNVVTVKDIPWWKFAIANCAGVILALVIGKLTEYFTSTAFKPVKETAKASRTGPATVILTGFAFGIESSVWSVVAIGATIIIPTMLFLDNPEMAAYGIALAGLGLLTTTGYILAMDTYGPISDNANGIFEMSGALKDRGKDDNAYKIVAKLDAVGNTTKALTKGFAIATAVIAAVALFKSFLADAGLAQEGIRLEWTTVFVGLLAGGAVPFLFSSFAITAVSRAAFKLVNEVRRQFREIKGIMEYDPRSGSDVGKPDYGKCVEIATSAAQKELMSPAILAICAPVMIGFGFGMIYPIKGAAALGGFLVGAILSGQLMAVLLSNAGGAWDNAKKLVEDGHYGGKGTECHKATVVGDTVGDPFKDTAGPALNPMIKVMNLVAVLMVPIIVQPIPTAVRIAITAIAGIALLGATFWSMRASEKEPGDAE